MSNRQRAQRDPVAETFKRKMAGAESAIKALNDDNKKLQGQVSALVEVILIREAELRDVKGPCESPDCRLHYAHRGQCSPHR